MIAAHNQALQPTLNRSVRVPAYPRKVDTLINSIKIEREVSIVPGKSIIFKRIILTIFHLRLVMLRRQSLRQHYARLKETTIRSRVPT